jgi:hypothetical protein
MPQNLPPVLLTSCVIASDPSVSLKDKVSRVKFTIESIEKWLAQSPGLRLVICDGSNFDFSGIVHEKFPEANVECIFFENNKELVGLYGKGYGEGEIVKYALLNSVYLRSSDFFVKCTAKLWVENFFDCLNDWNGTFVCKGYFSNVFSLFKNTEFSYIDTRFYIVSKLFYLENLASTYLHVDSANGYSLEHCFRDVILNGKFEKILLNVPPVICGVGGGSGTYYKCNLKRRIKEVIRLWLVKRNNRYKHLFR